MDEQTPMTPEQPAEQKTTQPAKDPNVHAALSYALGAITGIIFLLIEKENEYIRFHAAQSTVVFGALFVLNLIPGLNMLSLLIWPVTLILWIVLIYKAYTGERFALPVAGELAEKLMKSV